MFGWFSKSSFCFSMWVYLFSAQAIRKFSSGSWSCSFGGTGVGFEPGLQHATLTLLNLLGWHSSWEEEGIIHRGRKLYTEYNNNRLKVEPRNSSFSMEFENVEHKKIKSIVQKWTWLWMEKYAFFQCLHTLLWRLITLFLKVKI